MQNISAKFATSGAALFVALAASEASAQTPVYNWSGFYVGVNGGYAWGTTKFDGDKIKTNGVTAGLQAGYNWQLSSLVIGPEFDLNLSGVKGKEDDFFGDKSLKLNQRWSGSARLKVGLPVNGGPVLNNFLIYGTGGLAVSQWRVHIDDEGKGKATHFGWIVGAGVEMPLASNLSFKLEYVYADYGSKDYFGGGRLEPNQSIVRFGINYRFASPPPP